MKPTLNFISVTSSNLDSVAYDEDSRTLYVKFKRGGTFSYNPVAPEGYRSLLGAESMGKFFNENIKDNPTISWKKES